MPRNGSGVMSWPPNGDAVPNTTIESGKYNAFRADLLQDLNAPRPTTMGGTGANTALGGADALSPAGATIASAATVDLATSTGISLSISGAAAISSFGVMPAGVKRELTFLAAATLTNSASLVLPGNADIVTAAGDVAMLRSLGGGTWRCTAYQRAASAPYSPTGTETLKNKNLDDATVAFVDDADPTKKVKLQVSGVTTGTTRTLTVPDTDGTLLLSRRQQLVAGFRNLKVQATSASAVAITADAVTVEDSTGGCVRLININISADLGTAGLGGLDTGAEAANTWYYPWIIWDGTNTGCILSASATAPTMPAGYTHKARMGALRNDASSNLWRTLQIGRRTQVTIGTNPTASPVIISGNSGSPTTPTWTAVPIGAFVPPTASVIRGTMLMTQGDSTRAMLAPNNSYGAWNSANAAPVGNGNNGITGSFLITTIQFDLMLESANIYYTSSNGSTNVLLNGWEENL